MSSALPPVAAPHRDDVPVLRAVSASDRARQHRLCAAGARHGEGRAAQGGRRHDREGPADRARRPACRRNFPAASSSASRWRAPRSPSRGCCCSTSRCPRSTSSCASRCGRSCAGCSASSASPSSTSPIPSSKRSRSPIIVVVMEKGKIRQAGPARDVYDQPQRPLRRGISRRPERPHRARSRRSTVRSLR